ncbi:hypothetical protein [Streptomyces xantholiticus]|uniref:hypothetical protein n=1 Tax=Streptomyces xantholiticus TaxID=68285 RepID=UPI0016777CC0|nr:hypothetical protein [Streptomyces xantholiticus]GGW71418.1 hypothetical protein GCM10010381_65170 [Streptomyces xantholiticus]
MSYDSAFLWGPANFSGRPPIRLVVEGVAVGLVTAGLVAGSAVTGVLTGFDTVGSVVGVIVGLAAAWYLFSTNAGRVLVGAVALIGGALAWWIPGQTAQAVHAARGESRTVVVTEVHVHRYEGRNYVKNSCSVRLLDGTPVPTEAWRTCGATARAGQHLTMVFDPKDSVLPTDRILPATAAEALAGSAVAAVALVALCCVAVIRSQP